MRFDRNILGASLAALALSAPARVALAASPPSPPVVEYRIEVSLDPSTKMLQGRERLTWRNPSTDTVSELRFHMYLNAFKNNRSTFMRESGGQLRGDERGEKPGDWGWIDVLVDEDRRGRGAPAGRPLHPARRQRPGRSDGAPGAPLLPRPAARGDRPRHRLRSQAPAHLRPHGLRARLLPRRPVVPEDRRLRAGGDARANGRGLELPRVPRKLRVLRGLRQLRRVHDGAVEIHRRGHRQASLGNESRRPDHLPVRAERRPRLCLDGRPPLARHRVHLRPGPRRACGMEREGRRRARHDGSRDRVEARAGPSPAPARPRVGSRPLPALHQGGPVLLRSLVRRLPVRDPDGRRSPGRRHGLGRHGVPDVHHGRRHQQRSSSAGRFAASGSSRS